MWAGAQSSWDMGLGMGAETHLAWVRVNRLEQRCFCEARNGLLWCWSAGHPEPSHPLSDLGVK
jgi:hypothetical protein